jgi:membrane-bound serine protease (ClpP class)
MWGMKRGVIPAVFLAALTALFCAPLRADSPATQPAVDNRAAIIQIQGEIDDYSKDQLLQRFNQARAAGAHTIILDIDTYGGLVTSGLEISTFIKEQDDLHIIAYVHDKAISAGSMIAMACDEIVMNPYAKMGDCAPIIFGENGLEAMPPAERAKAESPVLQDFLESAKRNHRDPLLAAAMVDVTRVVYWVQNDAGEKRFVDDKDYATLIATGHWKDVPGAKVPIDGPTTLLTVDGQEAVQYGLASQTNRDVSELVRQRGYQIVAELDQGFGDQLVEVLSGAVVRGLLIVIFLQCLYVVLHAPGHGVAETIGLVALVLMLGVPLLTGYAQWWEILMIFLGLALVAIEIVLPGHFIPGITGGLLVIFGLIMTFIPRDNGVPILPQNFDSAWIIMQRGILVVAAAMISSMLLWIWLNRYLPKMPYVNRLILTATSGGGSIAGVGGLGGKQVASTVLGPGILTWPPIGAVGRAVSELRPGGSAEFFDPAISDRRITSVVSESGFLPAGTEIVVRELAGPSILVRKKV